MLHGCNQDSDGFLLAGVLLDKPKGLPALSGPVGSTTVHIAESYDVSSCAARMQVQLLQMQMLLRALSICVLAEHGSAS